MIPEVLHDRLVDSVLNGLSYAATAREFGVDVQTVKRHCLAEGVESDFAWKDYTPVAEQFGTDWERFEMDVLEAAVMVGGDGFRLADLIAAMEEDRPGKTLGKRRKITAILRQEGFVNERQSVKIDGQPRRVRLWSRAP